MKLSDSDARVCAVILCAGTGSRANLGYNKILYNIGNKPLVESALDAFFGAGADGAVLVVNPSDEAAIREISAKYDNITIVHGGDTRTQSVRHGLEAVCGYDIVAIHDGARPYVSPDLIKRTVESAAKFGSGIAAVKTTDTVKESDGRIITRSLDRSKLWNMQTPQAFRAEDIKKAYACVAGDYTDDAEVWTKAGHDAVTVLGEYENTKVTTPADLFKGAPERTKIGVGFDAHRLAEHRPLILGGVKIPHTKGLEGHSDADALTHAIMDALLSAAGLPDIGVLFPDTDSFTENISSLVLLDSVAEKLREKGFNVGNVSAVIMAQKPKLASYINEMRDTLAARLHVERERINISATTTEHLGIIGEEKGIAASAVCLLFY